MWRRNSRRFALLLAVGLAATLAGCASGGGGNTSSSSNATSASNSGKTITVWTLNEQPNRLALAQSESAKFTAATGVKVKLVGVDQDQFPQLLTAAAAAGTLPDVVAELPLANVRTMSSNDLDNTAAAAQIVKDLGAGTFTTSALKYTRSGTEQLAVPADGYPEILVYRKDLFAKAGLPAPTTYADVLNDAKILDSSTTAGIVLGDDPSTAFTQQTFEWAALANGCQLVDSSGNVTLDSKQCEDAFSWYGQLTNDYSIPGALNSTGTKTAYMAGKAAMTIWSSYLLPEMAGLDNDIMPTCPQCSSDPQFLAKNSGIVTALSGPDGSGPVTGGDVESWVVSSTAAVGPSEEYIEYMMSTGYLGWLDQAPEGMLPTRLGTSADPNEYAVGWQKLKTGINRPEQLTSLYSPSDIAAMQKSMNTFSRWGFSQGQGDLVGATLTQLPIPQAISSLANGDLSAEAAAEQAQKAVQSIQNSLK